jgi:hypothetical protein
MSSAKQDGWIARVLGVNVTEAGLKAGTAPKLGGAGIVAACDAWHDASEAVDAQIAALGKALRDSGDEELEEIADFGLNAVTANHKVPLMAALVELGSGSPEAIAKSGPKVLAAALAFRKHIESDARVAACDENPLGLAVSIRDTLGPVLAALEATLAAA